MRVLIRQTRSWSRVGGMVVAGVVFVGCGSGHRASVPTGGGPSAVALRTQGLTARVPSTIAAACERAARSYDGTVYCPTIVPVGPAKVSEYALNHSRSRRHRSYFLEMTSPSLMRLHGRGVAAAGGHWTLVAGTDPSMRSLVSAPGAEHTPKPLHSQIGATPVNVYRMPSYEDGGGLYGGHVVIAWNWRGVAYQVSVHDAANESRARLVAQGIIDQQSGG